MLNISLLRYRNCILDRGTEATDCACEFSTSASTSKCLNCIRKQSKFLSSMKVISGIGVASCGALWHVPVDPGAAAHVGLHKWFLAISTGQWYTGSKHHILSRSSHRFTVIDSVTCCCMPSQFGFPFPLYYIYVVISAWLHEHARRSFDPVLSRC